MVCDFDVWPIKRGSGAGRRRVWWGWRVREKSTNVHLTADVASCHSPFFLKGTWAKLQSGATDEQPGGSTFEPQWHLQYGQSAAQQAHQSKSALSSRCVWSQRSLTKPANSMSYWAFEKVSGEEKSQPRLSEQVEDETWEIKTQPLSFRKPLIAPHWVFLCHRDSSH